MPESLTVLEENTLERERIKAKIRDRARIFREAFGTPQGQMAFAALVEKFTYALPPNVLDNNGRTDEYQTWRRLGHFDVLEFITQNIDYREVPDVYPSKPSP